MTTEAQIATRSDGSSVLEWRTNTSRDASAVYVVGWQGISVDAYSQNAEKPIQLVIDKQAVSLSLAEYGALRELVLSGAVDDMLRIAQRGRA